MVWQRVYIYIYIYIYIFFFFVSTAWLSVQFEHLFQTHTQDLWLNMSSPFEDERSSGPKPTVNSKVLIFHPICVLC